MRANIIPVVRLHPIVCWDEHHREVVLGHSYSSKYETLVAVNEAFPIVRYISSYVTIGLRMKVITYASFQLPSTVPLYEHMFFCISPCRRTNEILVEVTRKRK
jgi:hypothetical protein